MTSAASAISTSPFAIQAFEIVQWLDKLVGPAEAQMFMLRTNEMLGTTPVQAIKDRRADDVRTAVRAIAMSQGLFTAPWLPPQKEK